MMTATGKRILIVAAIHQGRPEAADA